MFENTLTLTIEINIQQFLSYPNNVSRGRLLNTLEGSILIGLLEISLFEWTELTVDFVILNFIQHSKIRELPEIFDCNLGNIIVCYKPAEK